MPNPLVIDNPNPQDHLRTEWLLTNGLGGYAMGTVLGINTRRYHGLLVAATKPPVGRIVALHSMIEQLIIPRDDGTEEVIDLSTQMFVGPPPDGEPLIHPGGWRRLTKFELAWTSAAWTYQIGESRLIRTINWHPDQSLAITYLGSHLPRSRLRLRPLLSLRDSHSLNRNDGVYQVAGGDGAITIARGNTSLSIAPAGFKASIALVWVPAPEHWNQLAYIHDRERGQEWTENSWSPGYFEGSFVESGDDPAPPQVVSLGFTAAPPPAIAIPGKRNNHRRLQARADVRDPSVTDLLHAATSDFVVMRCSGRLPGASIIAGYPWFSDWGRDAMISLPGLLLCTKRFEEAKSLLLLFASHLRNGLIPNHFDDATGEPHYNTVDASLWFVYAVWQYWRATNSPASGAEVPQSGDSQSGGAGVNPTLLAACRAIIRAYRHGTDFGIRMDPDDGLISAGNESTQLTWMDAARDGVIFTPRHGKPVEVNALWFNALHCVAELTDIADEARDLRNLAARVCASFCTQFWREAQESLHDVLTPTHTAMPDSTTEVDSGHTGRTPAPQRYAPDCKLRPNQIFAVSLPFSPLAREQQRAVVTIVREKLLTPYGLRTLSPDDREYRGRFEGGLFERDRAYHNGTAWPWLLGPYCEAVLRINEFSEESRSLVREILQPLLSELSRSAGPGCLGQLAEVYDGDAPQRPGGCVAQAWSVAETLRMLTLIESPPPL